jgi:hypothetical protein
LIKENKDWTKFEIVMSGDDIFTMVKLKLSGQKRPLDEKLDRLREKLRKHKTFMINLFNLNKETLELIKMMSQEYHENIYQTMVFNLNSGFYPEHITTIKDVLTNPKNEYHRHFKDRQHKVIIHRRHKICDIIPCFKKIYLLVCDVHHLDVDTSQLEPIPIEMVVFMDKL